jgi:hypothetical protein
LYLTPVWVRDGTSQVPPFLVIRAYRAISQPCTALRSICLLTRMYSIGIYLVGTLESTPFGILLMRCHSDLVNAHAESAAMGLSVRTMRPRMAASR